MKKSKTTFVNWFVTSAGYNHACVLLCPYDLFFLRVSRPHTQGLSFLSGQHSNKSPTSLAHQASNEGTSTSPSPLPHQAGDKDMKACPTSLPHNTGDEGAAGPPPSSLTRPTARGINTSNSLDLSISPDVKHRWRSLHGHHGRDGEGESPSEKTKFVSGLARDHVI
jgi:hypothetical protein